jgi:hypothetical protein
MTRTVVKTPTTDIAVEKHAVVVETRPSRSRVIGPKRQPVFGLGNLHRDNG